MHDICFINQCFLLDCLLPRPLILYLETHATKVLKLGFYIIYYLLNKCYRNIVNLPIESVNFTAGFLYS